MNQRNPAPKLWLEYPTAAAYLDISVRALHRLVADGRIGYTRLGRSTLFSYEQLDEYVAFCTVAPRR